MMAMRFKLSRIQLIKKILTSNRVRALAEDNFERLWIGTDEGVSIYDFNEEAFKKIHSNELIKNGIS